MFLPEKSFGGVSSLIEAICIKIPDVKLLSSESKFPFAAAVSYFSALVGAFALALITSFARLDMRPLLHLVEGKSVTGRVVFFIGIVFFLLAPFVLEMSVGNLQFSSGFFELVKRVRFFLLFWVQGVFLGFYVLWLWLFLECANFLRFVLGVRNG